MDLSTIEGLELSEEQQKSILALHESETKGLRDNRDTLLTEKQEAKRLADEASAAAKEAAEKAALAEARKAGDLESFEKNYKAKLDDLSKTKDAEIEKYKNIALGGKRDSVVGELAAQFTSPEAAKMILGSMVEVGVNESNETVTTFKDTSGNLVSTDKAVFAEWLKGQDAFKPLIKAVESSGGGASGGSGGSGGAATSGDFMKMNAAQRVAYLKSKGK